MKDLEEAEKEGSHQQSTKAYTASSGGLSREVVEWMSTVLHHREAAEPAAATAVSTDT